jgi:hypothetical protein
MSEQDDRRSPPSPPPAAGPPADSGPPEAARAGEQAPRAPVGWAPPGWPPPLPQRASAVTRGDVVAAAVVAAAVAALGAPLGWLWSAIGPHVEVVMTAAGPELSDYNTEAFAGADVTFAAMALVAGVVVGAAGWALRRWRGPVLLAGLALGAVGSAVLTWKLGAWIGADDYRGLLADARVGQEFAQPMKLRATGLIFLQATVAVIVYVVSAAWSRHPDLGAGTGAPPDAPAADGGAAEVSSDPSAPEAPPAAPARPAAGRASSPPA